MKHGLMSTCCNCILAVAFMLGLGVFAAPRAQSQTFSVIYNFAGPRGDGGLPLAGLVIDASGNLYGTASYGGSTYNGVVFKVTQGGQETVLYNFLGGTDGSTPEASLQMDSAGNLYGTTNAGGAFGFGTVFKLTQSGQETVLYSFAGGTADGANPEGGLAVDRAHNIYGTTYAGGQYGAGTVFRLSTKGKETVLYSFGNGTDGANPVAGVTLGSAGEIYGTTSAGGTGTYGTVFQLTPVTATGSKYEEEILHNFTHQNDGDVPYAGLILDRAGNLYGAATGGGANNGGTIFELTPSASGWNFTVLYGLAGWDISGAFQNLFMDASGNIWGTTHCDGSDEAGTVFELTNSGGTWNYTSMYVFTGGADGLYSISNLVFDTQGNLYGTAEYGGAYNNGVVYKITP
ncbi:MAG TPA: choice-of-anchor tandem repeat GloVer-containing protein [Terriglobales bacterium]|jgi:uncharacterized repeat protein (TIGR03803 family)|nr:choice-of-anchor tandem repeat GloVer-containing protein [Terriglobales bacterium]